ncbi:MAG: alanine dehydrogenase, partial [Planctomycetota bacterium]
LASGAHCFAYETLEVGDSLPLLTPMSEVAGRMSIQEGAACLEAHHGGRGMLLGGVPGVEPANVMILGGGTVGTNAAKMAAAIREKLSEADLVVGAVLVSGARAPVLVRREDLGLMKNDGPVVVDVAVDQGGCIETCRPTTHDDPTFVVDGVVHYCVANMPGAVPRTSTFALTNATGPYARKLAGMGTEEAARTPILQSAANILDGKITCEAVAEAFDMDFTPPDRVF